MIVIFCTSCNHGLRIIEETGGTSYLIGTESEFWPDSYKCFNCQKNCSGYMEPEVDQKVLASLRVFNVTAEEAYAAVQGLGLPSERTCCEEVIRPLFEQHGIKAKGRQLKGTTRFCLDSLEFRDGTKLYLAASPQGATIYRIARPHSYTEAVLHDTD